MIAGWQLCVATLLVFCIKNLTRVKNKLTLFALKHLSFFFISLKNICTTYAEYLRVNISTFSTFFNIIYYKTTNDRLL